VADKRIRNFMFARKIKTKGKHVRSNKRFPTASELAFKNIKRKMKERKKRGKKKN
jgi:hypothetical protein